MTDIEILDNFASTCKACITPISISTLLNTIVFHYYDCNNQIGEEYISISGLIGYDDYLYEIIQTKVHETMGSYFYINDIYNPRKIIAWGHKEYYLITHWKDDVLILCNNLTGDILKFKDFYISYEFDYRDINLKIIEDL